MLDKNSTIVYASAEMCVYFKYHDETGGYKKNCETNTYRNWWWHLPFWSFLVFLTEENPQRSQTSTIANTDNMFTYVGQK
jgi:hypothetical protein